MIFSEDLPIKPPHLRPGAPQSRQQVRVEQLMVQIESWKSEAEKLRTTFKQAHHLINRFGGILPTSLFCGVTPQEIIKTWLVINDGLIPTVSLCALIVSARYLGIYLKPEDIYPDFLGNDQMTRKDMKRWLKKTKCPNWLEGQLASLASIQDLTGV